jgi:hypothetical protein
MEFSIEFGSRDILDAHPDLEEKIITEIFNLSLNQVLLTDLSDLHHLQDLNVLQQNLKNVFNLELSIEVIEELNMGQLVTIIENK